jgi:hypothetical protein
MYLINTGDTDMAKARFTRKAIEVAEIKGHDTYARVVIHTVNIGRPYQILTMWHDGLISTAFAETLAHARDCANAVLDTVRDEGATAETLHEIAA